MEEETSAAPAATAGSEAEVAVDLLSATEVEEVEEEGVAAPLLLSSLDATLVVSSSASTEAAVVRPAALPDVILVRSL